MSRAGGWVQLQFTGSTRRSLANTFEDMKLALLRRNRSLPNPATFALETRQNYAVEGTLLPIAKGLLATVG